MLGVVKLVTPEPPVNTVPAVETEYQSMVDPVAGVAEITTGPVPHLEPVVPIGAAGATPTVAITAVLVGEIQVVPILDST